MPAKPAKNSTPPRPALNPFDVELSPAAQDALRKNIEAINVQLERGNRGYFDVPTGHANRIKAAFEDAKPGEGGDAGGARRWRITIVAVNPTFAKIAFHANGDPEPPPGEPALALLAQVRAEVAKLLSALPIARGELGK